MNNREVASKVVERIVAEIESGKPLPWVKPWNDRPNVIKIQNGVKVITLNPVAWNRKGVEYKGVNTYLPLGEYITFNQCKAEGGTIRKGAHGYPVVYWNFYSKERENPETGEIEKVRIPVLKYYTVFNVADCEGITQKHNPKPRTLEIPTYTTVEVEGNTDQDFTAETVIMDYVANAGNGFHLDRDEISDEAFYSPLRDFVKVPRREQYGNLTEYYSTIFHELAHSTGHATRLNRFTGKAAHAAFGSQEYSKEELVAESTAASLLNALGMEEANAFRNSAAYIKSWSRAIKSEPLMFVSAATKAQAAFDYILGIKADEPDAEPVSDELIDN